MNWLQPQSELIDVIVHSLLLHHPHLLGHIIDIRFRIPFPCLQWVLLEQQLFKLMRSIEVGFLRLHTQSGLRISDCKLARLHRLTSGSKGGIASFRYIASQSSPLNHGIPCNCRSPSPFGRCPSRFVVSRSRNCTRIKISPAGRIGENLRLLHLVMPSSPLTIPVHSHRQATIRVPAESPPSGSYLSAL